MLPSVMDIQSEGKDQQSIAMFIPFHQCSVVPLVLFQQNEEQNVGITDHPPGIAKRKPRILP